MNSKYTISYAKFPLPIIIIIITVPNAFFSLAKVLQAKLVGQNS